MALHIRGSGRGNADLEERANDDNPLNMEISNKLVAGVIGGITAAAIAWGSWFYVPLGNKAVVTRFGQYQSTQENGLHGKLPFVDSTYKVNVEEVRRNEFGFRTIKKSNPPQYEDRVEESLMITGDENLIDVSWVVQSKVRDPVAYLYSMADPEATLYDISESAMRLVVGDSTVDAVMTDGKTRIQERAKELMQTIVNAYNMGLEIQSVQLQDADPPTKEVEAAFAAVNSAKENKARMQNQADTYSNEKIPAANAVAKQKTEAALAYAAQAINNAEGQRDAFLTVLKEYQKAPELTRRRVYIETMEAATPQLKDAYVMDGKQTVYPLLNLKKE